MIVEIINRSFDGDMNNERPLHANSLCRIAYAGYLSCYKNHTSKEIAEMTNSKQKTVTNRIKKHRDFYAVDLIYKRIFDNILEQLL